MDIKYLGHASFFIKTKNARLITDPFDPKIGLKFAKTEADVVTVSHQHPDHNNVALVNSNPLIIDWPGEFEKLGIRISGFSTYHDKTKGSERGENTVYKIEAEGVSVLHCGDLGLIPDDSFIEQLGVVNVLMVPVGGFYTIDANEAVSLIKKIDPSIIIPMHFGRPELDQATFGKLTPLEDFLKKMGAEAVAPVNKLTLKEGDFTEDTKVVVMEIG